MVVQLGDGTPLHFDHVVLALHSDQALRLLADVCAGPCSWSTSTWTSWTATGTRRGIQDGRHDLL